MATMKDIALKAGVSIATVSKVLNNQGSISPGMRQKILNIADELDYVPNIFAQNLKNQKNNVVGIIAEDLTVFNTPPIIEGIGSRLEQDGFHYILENMRIKNRDIDPDANFNEYMQVLTDSINFMKSMRIDGIIYVSCHSHRIVSLPEIKGVNFVCAYCTSAESSIPSISYDDNTASFDVTSMLIKKGHKKIGLITGPTASIHTENRTAGYKEALSKSHISLDEGVVVHGDWARSSGFQLCPYLLTKDISAIVCQNDLMALGAIDYCLSQGLTPGKDIDIVGFDDREISKLTRPSISTVKIPLEEIGIKAADDILKLINRVDDIDVLLQSESLPCEIITRESTGMT